MFNSPSPNLKASLLCKDHIQLSRKMQNENWLIHKTCFQIQQNGFHCAKWALFQEYLKA